MKMIAIDTNYERTNKVDSMSVQYQNDKRQQISFINLWKGSVQGSGVINNEPRKRKKENALN